MNKSLVKIESLLEKGKFHEANEIMLNFRENELSSINISFEYIKYICLLIDLGSKIENEIYLQEGIEFFNNNISELKDLITYSSIYYNLGNGYKELFDLRRKRREFKYSIENLELLSNSKICYLKSLKNLNRNESTFEDKIYTNLANVLDVSGRVVEALYFYEKALKINSNLYEAVSGKGIALGWLNILSNQYSIRLICEIVKIFGKAKRIIPKYHDKEYINYLFKNNYDVLLKRGLSYKDAILEIKKHENTDYKSSLSKEELFYLENSLFINYHSLYCNCLAGIVDDLKIKVVNEQTNIQSKNLNFIMGEYKFARFIFYKSVVSEIYREEYLRTSFRLLYSILDKIASSILEFFGIDNKNMYFERFWRKNLKFWDIIKSKNNFGFIALHSMAADLDKDKGEFGNLKKMRNDFEHNIITIQAYELHQLNQILFQFVKSAIIYYSIAINNEENHVG